MQMNVKISNTLRARDLVILALTILLLAEMVNAMHWREGGFGTGDVLRVAVPKHEWVRGAVPQFGPGFEQELLDAYCRDNGLRWKRLTPASWDEAWDMLRDGRADVVLGLGSTPPADLAETVAPGPVYASFNPVIIHNNRRYGVRQDCEMCDRPILVSSNTELHDALQDKAAGMDCTPSAVVSDGLDILPLLETLSANQARFALVDEGRFRLWQPFYYQLRMSRALPGAIDYRWYWNTHDEARDSSLEAFWTRMDQSPKLADLYDKYFGFLPEDGDAFEVFHLQKTLREALPKYGAAIARAALKNDIDPLLLVAVIYQESRFDENARSKTGVRGLMQITTDTARLLGVDRTDPLESIKGGARYLRMLHDNVPAAGLDERTRWLFALAAYNRGPGHLTDALDLSRRLGGYGNSWRELKDVFPKLAWERWYKDTKYGYTRGYEVVNYVERIRYFHYILRGLVTLERPEAELLAAVYGGKKGAQARAKLAAAPQPTAAKRDVALAQ